MRELSNAEVPDVNGGGVNFNIGTAVAACAIGIIFGGPVGLGTALCGIT